MAGTLVTISGDTATLTVKAVQIDPANPNMEFSSGSFKASVDERRVALLQMAIPTGSKRFSIRFEFTDPSLASMDTRGVPVYITQEERITPYREQLPEVGSKAEDTHRVSG
jgi:hypothetical protein